MGIFGGWLVTSPLSLCPENASKKVVYILINNAYTEKTLINCTLQKARLLTGFHNKYSGKGFSNF